jgi:hypothetical protein
MQWELRGVLRAAQARGLRFARHQPQWVGFAAKLALLSVGEVWKRPVEGRFLLADSFVNP